MSLNPALKFFQDPQVRQLISRASQVASVPLSLHHISNWPLQNEGGCEACRFIHEHAQGREACAKDRLAASRLALSSGVPVTFSCHLGFSCVSLAALPEGDYVFTLGPYLPMEASEAIEAEVSRAVALLCDDVSAHEPLPFTLTDLRRSPSESVAAAGEWLVETLTRLYAEYEWEEETEEETEAEEKLAEPVKKRYGDSQKRGEAIRLQIAAAYLLFGKRAVVRAILEDCLEEMEDASRTQGGCLVESISAILDHARHCGGEVEPCLRRFPDFVATTQELDDRNALLSEASHLFKRVSSKPMQDKYGIAFSDMLGMLYTHHKESHELRDFARQDNMQASTLTRRIEKVTGVKFAELLGRIRVIHAQRLLRRTRLSATKIALHVGIRNQSNFTKLFKEYTGLTPGQYRKHYKQK